MADAGGEARTGGDIAELAQALRARQALGRSDTLNRLFDYLAQTASAGVRPKEFEVAAAVFGRDAAFDGAQDASVRVAVHRLRRKLDEFYAGPGLRHHAVFAARDGQPHGVVAAGAGVEVVELAAQPVHRHADARVLGAVEGGAAAEDGGGHLELLGPGPGRRAVRQVIEEPVQPVGAAQRLARAQARGELRHAFDRRLLACVRQCRCNLL